MGIHVGYDPAPRTCSGKATPGAKALMSWYLGAYGPRGAANLGIYVCKTIAGSKTPSLHGDGRADDLGTAPYAYQSWLQPLADALVNNSKELGVQCVIFNRRIWSGSYPYEGWRHYGGSEPHNGHIHVELDEKTGSKLTVARIQSVLGGAKPSPPPSSTDWTRRMLMALPVLKDGAGKKGSPNQDVRSLQGLLLARGHSPGALDGIFRDKTTAALRAFQKARKITVDGIAGKVSWHHLHNQQRLL